MSTSWQEEFKREYTKPVVEPVTVGFSGIDPNLKTLNDDNLGAEVWKKLQELEIRIDSGNIDPEDPEPSPEPVQPIITTTDHEKLENLLGGNENGHYHLTEAELEKLRTMPTEGVQGTDGKAATIRLGTVSTGQPGSTVKITNTGTETAAVFNFTIPQGAKGDKGETGAQGVQGKDGATGATGAAGKDGKAATIRIGNTLTGLPGSEAIVTNSGTVTDAVLNFTIPKGEKGDRGERGEKGEKGEPAEGVTGNHEELEGLLGGSTEEGHYHMTKTQHHKLEILIKTLFPTGTDTIYVPYIDDRDPDNPIPLPYTPFTDLPKGKPPEWKIASLPEKYEAISNTYPYYGAFPDSTFNNGLFVLLKVYGSSNSYGERIVNTNNLQNWTAVTQSISNYKGIVYLGDNWINATSKKDIIYLINKSGTNVFCGYDEKPLATNISMQLKSASHVMATCISPEMNILLVAGQVPSGDNIVYVNKKIKWNSAFTVAKQISTFTVTRNGLAWSPDAQLFCLCGDKGTYTSADGENWVPHTDAPKNLTDLSYRADLGCLFARSINEKIFYASGDGIDWKPVTATPIPLETVACVDYSYETGIYCAVGGTGRYAYFSKDLQTWVPTLITNGADIEAGSVIYMPSTKKYVLMPTSGSYYYTFDPSEWVD